MDVLIYTNVLIYNDQWRPKNNFLWIYFWSLVYVFSVRQICSLDSVLKMFLQSVLDLPYRLSRLKPRATKFRWPPAKVYNIFDSVIGLSYTCCHNALQTFNNFKHPSSSSASLKLFNLTLFHFPLLVRMGGGLEGPHIWNSLKPLFI